MTINPNKYHQRLEKKIESFSARLMSDTKWTKVFKTLSQHSDLINKCLIKDIWNDVLREIHIPSLESYTETFHNSGIKDVMTGGPSVFKEIEWVEFPSNWVIARQMRNEKLEPHKYSQDILKIKECLLTVGQLEIEMETDKLILYGYK